jgi:hypothetical protein
MILANRLLTSSMKRLSEQSAFAINSFFCPASFPSLAGALPMSSSWLIEPSILGVPIREGPGCPWPAFELGGNVLLISLDTITRPELTSNKRSHEPETSKIGFVTPAIYAGLFGKNAVKVKCQDTKNGYSHRFPLVPVRQIRIRERSFDEAPQNNTTPRPQSTSRQHIAGHLSCGPIIA